MTVDVDTEHAFQGRIYAKGEAHRQECVRTFGGRPEPWAAEPKPWAAEPNPWAVESRGGYGAPPPSSGDKVGIELKFGECNMRRQRTVGCFADDV